MCQVPWYPEAEAGMTAADLGTSTHPIKAPTRTKPPKLSSNHAPGPGVWGGRSQVKLFKVIKADECIQGSGNQNAVSAETVNEYPT